MEKVPKVFIIHEPQRINHGQPERFMDFSPAAVFGELEVLITGKVSAMPGPMTHTLRQKLANFSDHDYLLATGDPGAIGAACCIAAEMNRGRYKLLKWIRSEGRYISQQYDIRGIGENGE